MAVLTALPYKWSFPNFDMQPRDFLGMWEQGATIPRSRRRPTGRTTASVDSSARRWRRNGVGDRVHENGGRRVSWFSLL